MTGFGTLSWGQPLGDARAKLTTTPTCADNPEMDHESSQTRRDQTWTFLSNHGAVILLIAADPAAPIDSLSRAAGISRRAAQMIVADLCRAGYVVRTRTGRRNRYTINRSLPLRHRAVRDLATVSGLLGVIDRDLA